MWVLLAFVAMVLIGVPVGYSMILTGFLYIVTGAAGSAVSLTLIPTAMVSGISSYTMLAIPFFMLVGEFMNGSGITRKIFKFASAWVGHITGGLGLVNVLSSMLFAGMSGAAVADCAGLGPIEIQAMKDGGYDADFSVGVTAASSIIGPIIPPSSPMVMFGIVAGISVGSLFMGGISVGIVMGLTMMITVYVIAKKRGYPTSPKTTWKEKGIATKEAIPALLGPVILLGGLFSGYFTPTEAAAVAVFYTILVGIFVYHHLNKQTFYEVLSRGVENLGMVMLLMSTGKLFAWILGMEKVAEAAATILFSLTSNKYIIILLLNLVLLFMGTFMETNASILILTPIMLPIVNAIGMHPVQFGVIFIFALMIGLLTPPMAMCLFITSKIGGISFQQAFKATTPYYIGLLVVLALVNIFPQIILTIPRAILGSAF